MFNPNDSGLHRDYLMSGLRSQEAALRTILHTLENTEQCESRYVEESLREMERGIRALRRMNCRM